MAQKTRASASTTTLTKKVAPTSTSTASGQEIDGLLSGVAWTSFSLTYSFPNSPADYGKGYSEANKFEAFSLVQQGAMRDILRQVEDLTNLGFVDRTDSVTGANTDGAALLRFAETAQTKSAWSYYPSETAKGGDAWFAKSGIYDAPAVGNEAYATFMHELGHSLGLKHSFENTSLGTVPRDSLEYTVMSYSSYENSGNWYNVATDYPQTFMLYDIAALQHMYGADFETRKADTTYTWTPSEGSLVIRENGIAVDVIDAPNTDTIFMTIWDGGGEDTFDFGLFSTELLIDLRPGEWIKTDVRGNSQTADLDGVRGSELADGNIANAYLYTDPTTNTVRYESLIENAIGGSKSDVFVANVEGNTFTGGGSGDVFRWMTLDDLLNRSPEGDDVIVDFARGDHIDFRYLDISTAPGLQSFSFHAQAKGTWSAGDLWYDQATDKLFGELNGDSYWDFGLDIGADYAMARSDLWLRPGDDLLA